MGKKAESKRRKKFRLQFLYENPLCEVCGQRGKLAQATAVIGTGPYTAVCKQHGDSGDIIGDTQTLERLGAP